MNRTNVLGGLALVAVLLSAGALTVALTSGSDTVSTEVRISARPLDDGRVEFALQQRTDDGWGERQLARARYLPASAEPGRWRNSSPYVVQIPLTDRAPVSDDEMQEESSSGNDEPQSATPVEAPEYLVEIISLRPIKGYSMGYSVTVRNNTDRPIRSLSIHVEARNNVGIVGTCSTLYEYICDNRSYSTSYAFDVDRRVVSGGRANGTITLTEIEVRRWWASEDIEMLSATIGQVEFRTGKPAQWFGDPMGCQDYLECLNGRQTFVIHVD